MTKCQESGSSRGLDPPRSTAPVTVSNEVHATNVQQPSDAPNTSSTQPGCFDAAIQDKPGPTPQLSGHGLRRLSQGLRGIVNRLIVLRIDLPDGFLCNIKNPIASVWKFQLSRECSGQHSQSIGRIGTSRCTPNTGAQSVTLSFEMFGREAFGMHCDPADTLFASFDAAPG